MCQLGGGLPPVALKFLDLLHGSLAGVIHSAWDMVPDRMKAKKLSYAFTTPFFYGLLKGPRCVNSNEPITIMSVKTYIQMPVFRKPRSIGVGTLMGRRLVD